MAAAPGQPVSIEILCVILVSGLGATSLDPSTGSRLRALHHLERHGSGDEFDVVKPHDTEPVVVLFADELLGVHPDLPDLLEVASLVHLNGEPDQQAGGALRPLSVMSVRALSRGSMDGSADCWHTDRGGDEQFCQARAVTWVEEVDCRNGKGGDVKGSGGAPVGGVEAGVVTAGVRVVAGLVADPMARQVLAQVGRVGRVGRIVVPGGSDLGEDALDPDSLGIRVRRMGAAAAGPIASSDEGEEVGRAEPFS